jgi:RAB protein geranylgeranyltransferase component A
MKRKEEEHQRLLALRKELIPKMLFSKQRHIKPLQRNKEKAFSNIFTLEQKNTIWM